jgi:hypothetical protein
MPEPPEISVIKIMSHNEELHNLYYVSNRITRENKIKRKHGNVNNFLIGWTRISWLDSKFSRRLSSGLLLPLTIKAANTSETSVNYYQITWRNNPETSIFKLPALRCNAVWTCSQTPTFRRNILFPSSGLVGLYLKVHTASQLRKPF